MPIKAIIWDLDNTLYQFTEALRYYCNVAAAKAVIEAGLDLSFDEALEIAIESELTYQYSLHEFILNHGMSYKDLHHPFHDHIDETLAKPIDSLDNNLCSVTLPQAILTNASKSWAIRVLKFLELENIFDSSLIFCMEDFDYNPKARSNHGIELALHHLGSSPSQTIIIDDLSRNLKMAKILGLRTALTNRGADNKEDHIDYYLNSTNDFFKLI